MQVNCSGLLCFPQLLCFDFHNFHKISGSHILQSFGELKKNISMN